MGSHASPRTRRQRRVWPVVAVAVVVLAGGGWAFAQSQGPGEPDATAPPATRTMPQAPPQQEHWSPSEQTVEQAREIVADLSIPDLAGQLIVARHFDEASSLDLVRDRGFAGVMVTTQHVLDVTTEDPLSEVRRFNTELRQAGAERGRPVLIPIDQEGGVVARLRDPLTAFPSFMTAGAAVAGDGAGDSADSVGDGEGDDEGAGASAVREAARGSGDELRTVGYNAAMAPVADLTAGPSDPLIRTRASGSEPDVAAEAVAAAVEGYGEAGLLSATKHFPGHRVNEDSHRALPRLEGDESEVAATDLPAFEAAIDVEAPMIMTGHLDVPAYDDGTPASMSRPVITGLLREELGYDGVIISDSLGMGPIMERYPGGEAAVAALVAGSDLALMPADNVAAHEAVTAAIESGDLPEAQARESAVRVLAWTMLAEEGHNGEVDGQADGEGASDDAAPGSRAEAAQALSAAGLTSLGCEPVPDIESVTPVGDPSVVARFTEAAAEAELPIGGGTVVSFVGNGYAGSGDVAVATGTPYVLGEVTSPVRLALYDDGLPAMRALVDVLAEAAEPAGALTVDVPGVDGAC